MIRLALIGPGAWGKNYIEAAKETGMAEVVNVVGRDWRERLSVPPGFAPTTSDTVQPAEAVIVATPPEVRTKICVELADRGIPMMVEKPICLSVKEVEEIGRALGQGGASLLVDHTHLFSPAYEALRMFVRSAVGRVRLYFRTYSPAVRAYSPLWDHGPHDLAMCLGLGLGPPVHASATRSEDHVDMDVHFDEGDAAHMRVIHGPKRKTLVVMCGDMGAVYNACLGTLEVNGKSVPVSDERPLTRAVRAFAQAVKDGGTDDWRFGIEDSVTITKTLEAVQG